MPEPKSDEPMYDAEDLANWVSRFYGAGFGVRIRELLDEEPSGFRSAVIRAMLAEKARAKRRHA